MVPRLVDMAKHSYLSSDANHNNREMDFITLDFETATAKRDSPCEVGISIVREGQIVENFNSLIKPHYAEFNHWNVAVHGITATTVANAPSFPEIWNQIAHHFENALLIAHNAAFDISVLRQTLSYYSIPYPALQYACSYQFSKRVWPYSHSHRLDVLCAQNGITFSHHRAGNDAKATALLTLKAFELAGVYHSDDLTTKLQVRPGRLSPEGFTSASTIKAAAKRSAKEPLIGQKLEDARAGENVLAGKEIVFTGMLSSLARADAESYAAKCGALIGSRVSKRTKILVVGMLQSRTASSTKLRQAQALKNAGLDIEVWSEPDFLRELR